MRGGRCSRCVRGYRTFERLMTIVVVVWARVAGMWMPVVTRAWTALDYSTVGGRLGVRSVRTSWRPGSAASRLGFHNFTLRSVLAPLQFLAPMLPMHTPARSMSASVNRSPYNFRWSALEFFCLKAQAQGVRGGFSTQYSVLSSRFPGHPSLHLFMGELSEP